MNDDFIKKLYLSQKECTQCPSPTAIREFFDVLLGTLFPDFAKQEHENLEEFNKHLEALMAKLCELLKRNALTDNINPEQMANTFFEYLPEVYNKLKEDIEGLYSGDPAAKSRSEIIRSYPGFYAIAAYRIAHQLVTPRSCFSALPIARKCVRQLCMTSPAGWRSWAARVSP